MYIKAASQLQEERLKKVALLERSAGAMTKVKTKANSPPRVSSILTDPPESNDEENGVGRVLREQSRPQETSERETVPSLPESWQRKIYTAYRADDIESLELILSQYRASHNADDALLKSYFRRRFPPEGNTLLHMACGSGHAEVVDYSLRKLCLDPTLKNRAGQVAYHTTANKTVRNVFIKFRTDVPDAWDWNAAGGVPEPLDPEAAAAKKAKDAARKSQARKARNEKQKAQKAKDAEEKMEKEERDRFLNLSDREKRALAAERRIAQQVAESTGDTVVLSRCFLCASDITGKVPFEYSGNRFCSIGCLKKHRAREEM